MEELGNKSMMDFQTSFNMFMGTSNPLNWFDNPYIEMNVYELTDGFERKPYKDVKFRKCDQPKDLIQQMSPHIADYYPNALCFDDLRKIKLLGNWFDDKYSNMIISIDACRNTTETPNKCASLNEIE